MNRKDALKRLEGLEPQVGEHLAKITADPEGRDARHWSREVTSWLEQMERLLPALGKKTAEAWGAKLAGWKDQLEE